MRISPGNYFSDASARRNLYAVLLCVGLLAASFILTMDDTDTVRFRGTALPQSCAFKGLFGMDCPTCGLTRSFIMLSRMEPTKAWHYNAGGVFIYAYIVLQIPYRAYLLWSHRNQAAVIDKALTFLSIAIAAALTLNWIVVS